MSPDSAAEAAAAGDAAFPGDGEPLLVDARGLRCPLPVIRLAAATRDAAPGTRVRVLWTDPAARHDVPAWARLRGHAVEGTAPWVPDGDPGASPPVPVTFATVVRLAR